MRRCAPRQARKSLPRYGSSINISCATDESTRTLWIRLSVRTANGIAVRNYVELAKEVLGSRFKTLWNQAFISELGPR